MADVSNLKINQSSNVQWPNLQVTKIGNKNWKKKIYIKLKIWELVKLRVARTIVWTNNFEISNFWSQILVFRIKKILKIC